MNDFFLKPFLDILAADGIRVTISDYSRITLALRAEGPWDLERVRGVLLALLVKSPEQEELFLRRFESFFDSDLSISTEHIFADVPTALTKAIGERKTVAPDKESVSSVATLEEDERKPWRTRRYVKPLIVGIMLIVLIPSLYIFISKLLSPSIPKLVNTPGTPAATATPTPISPPVPWDWLLVLANFALTAFLVVGAYLLFRWLSRAWFPRQRRPQFDPAAPRHFNLGVVGGKPPPHLDSAALDYLAGLVGYGLSGKMSASLDMRASVDIAARSGGLPTLVYSKQKLIQTIYIVEDARSEPSVWNSVPRELAEGLAVRGVPVVYGKFYGSPERFETADGTTYWLDELETLNPNYPVVVFSDSQNVSQAWAAALRALARRPMLVWMELRERRFWDEKTELIAQHGIPVYPATSEGTLQAFSRFQTAQNLLITYPTNRLTQHRMPAFSGADVDFQVEWLLGDALLWAQACAMIQPLTLGLADSLRCQFQPHLPPERIGRLFILPGTTHSNSGLRFSDPVLAALKSGFAMRWDDEKQEEILRYILNKIDEVEPAQKNSLAHLSWQWVAARVRLELDPDRALEDIERLVQTPLGNHIKAELENVYVADSTLEGYAHVTPGRIPVRQGVKGEFPRRRLALITEKFDRQKTEREISADNHWEAIQALALDPMMLHSHVVEKAVGALRKSVAKDDARSMERPAQILAPIPLKAYAAKLLSRRRAARATRGTGSGRGDIREEVRSLPIYKGIYIGLAAGAVAGILCNVLFSVPGLAPAGGTLPHPQVLWVIEQITEPLGMLFLRLLLMTAVPLAFSSLVVGIAGIGKTRQLSRIGLKMFAYTLVVSTISVVIGLVLATTIRPGQRIDSSTSDALNRRYGDYAQRAVETAREVVTSDTPLMWVVKTIVPHNPVASAAGVVAGTERQTDTPNLLHLMFFALLIGIASTSIPSEVVAPLLNGLKAFQVVTAKIIDIVMRLAPFACACLLFNTTARLGSGLLGALVWFIGTVLLGLVLLCGVYALSVYFLSRLSPLEFFRRTRTVMLTAFSVSSSIATLPVALRVAEENLGVPRQINSFILTVGATVNQNGSALYQGMAVLFLAQLAGVDLSLGQQLTVVYLTVLGGIGILAVPSGTIPFIIGLLAAFGIPPEFVAVILGVDRILVMFYTTLNVTGDITAATYVARSEGYELLRQHDSVEREIYMSRKRV